MRSHGPAFVGRLEIAFAVVVLWRPAASSLLHKVQVRSGVFEDLFAPVTRKSLREIVEESQFLVGAWPGLASKRLSFLQGIFSVDDFSDIVMMQRRNFPDVGGSHPIGLYAAEASTPGHRILKWEDVFPHFWAGQTLVMNDAQNLHAPLHRLNSALSDELGCMVFTNAYLSPPGATSAFTHHVDQTDTIIAQISGSKTWSFCNQDLLAVVSTGQQCPQLFDAEVAAYGVKEPQNCTTAVLQPGDFRFVRKGVVHIAKPHDLSTPSLHITIALRHDESSYFSLLLPLFRTFAEEDNSSGLSLLCELAKGMDALHRPIKRRRELLAAINVEDVPSNLLVSLADDVLNMLQPLQNHFADNVVFASVEECIGDFRESLACSGFRDAVNQTLWSWQQTTSKSGRNMELSRPQDSNVSLNVLTLDSLLVRPWDVRAYYRDDGLIVVNNHGFFTLPEERLGWCFALSYWRHSSESYPFGDPPAFAVRDIPAATDDIQLAIAVTLVLFGALEVRSDGRVGGSADGQFAAPATV